MADSDVKRAAKLIRQAKNKRPEVFPQYHALLQCAVKLERVQRTYEATGWPDDLEGVKAEYLRREAAWNDLGAYPP